MPTLTIDGKSVDFALGQSIIEVALANDIEVPHFCWHPSLSVSGNCRMCFVEIDGMPKLQASCALPAAEGQVIHTQSARAVQGREAIMEFLLINHPLDCPICDEAGQCKLQDYAFLHGRRESRFEEMKNRKEKRVPLGPEVLFDAERCISCSRCIRFADEIAEQPVLTFTNRGDHVTIETFPGTEFDSPYSMNVIDICPVGALTSRDFRFKARVWDMSFNESICPGCARGCNVAVGVRDNEILRLEPRTNMHVNEFWMCDIGRLTMYPHINENRFDGPVIRRGETKIGVSWEEATSEAVTKLRGLKGSEIAVIASTRATLEENHALQRFAKEVLGTDHLIALRHNDPGFADSKLRVADRSPNTTGVQSLGITVADSLEQLMPAITGGKIRALYILDQDILVDEALEDALDKMDAVIVHAANHTPITNHASIIFATSAWAEKQGTYVNIKGVVQYVDEAVATRENDARMGMKKSRLDKFGAHNDRWTHGTKRDCKPAWQTLATLARLLGKPWKYRWAEDLFEEITEKHADYAEMTYETLEGYHGIELGKGARPTPHPREYVPHFYRPQQFRDEELEGQGSPAPVSLR